MLGPTMLRVVSQQFWVRLYGPISSIMLGVVGTCCVVHARRVGRRGCDGFERTPPPPRAEKVRLEGSKDGLTKKREPQR